MAGRMLKFIRGKGQQPSAERQRLQNELFAFRKTVQHGFPHRASALSWDPLLRLAALGTATGALKVYGRPGVEFYGQHTNPDAAIIQIKFIPGTGRLISLCDDNSLHLWEINEKSLVELKSYIFEGKNKKVSSMCVESSGKHLLLGTEGGNIYSLDLTTFAITDDVIYQDVVMQNCPEDFKVNPGAVESICEHPKVPLRVLIGYNRGLVVLWDRGTAAPTHTFVSNQQLESLCWNDDGEHFTSSHNDGSYVTWEVAGAASDRPLKEPVTPYGPYPCKAINKILIRTSIDGEEVTIYAGGMPRASYSDKYTVTVQQGEKHVAFDFTSRSTLEDTAARGSRRYVTVKIQFAPDSTGVRQSLPECAGVFLTAYSLMERNQFRSTGGMKANTAFQWILRGLKRSTTSGEEIGENNDSQNEEEEWPPFRRVGTFDPYSDDPRLAVKKVILCPLSGKLTIGGAAGHIVIASLSNSSNTGEIKTMSVNIVSDRDGFVWKGHDQLTLRSGIHSFPQGYQVTSVVQLHPPAAVTSLGAHWEWGLVCVGTAHGLALLDAICAKPLLHKCTLNPHDHSGAGDTPISRRKSFKKSLRESFRRLRKGRSQRRQTTAASPTSPAQPAAKKAADKAAAEADTEIKPVERAVEARSNDDAFGSMVRCLYFARTFLVSTQNSTPTLWAGTNNGTVYAFTIHVPNTNKRKEDPVTCQLAKEIQLKHRAPVIGITILDGGSSPLPDPLEVERGVAALPEAGAHRVVITSEEQFKVFTLPALKPHHKYKLTAHEGARVRRTAWSAFECGREGEKHREWCLLCLTNLGDCLVLSADLRRQLNAAAVRKEDINGISSLCFSKRGEALYLHSSSEIQRITLSATKVTIARCHILLSPWAVVIRGTAEEPPLTNGEAKEEVLAEAVHDVTAASGDITVDSVRDHTNTPGEQPELNINLQNSQVNTSSMVVKTTTRTTVNDNNTDGGNTTSTTTTTTNSTTENILEHSREEGVITRIETGTVTVPAGTDPKLILEMFDRQRSPLSVPVPPASTPTETH
ncbi:protein lethal(2) giant larvae [Hyposmocoma kahamanoa]|uniref:protein lethal(2) giant larvae n=1 Tax=Hyposmocoma kahamanoa TaxID=1477025 RepID=UPI000E6D69AA|nr:protein lethal(2) giant larvae [Hyposmocoma kahamanoa]